jgi:hypothetical protein
VTDWQVVFLGVMAFALVAMAAAQLVLALSMMRALKHVSQAVDDLRRDVRPLVDKANRIADDAGRVAAMAAAQAERLDLLIRSTTARIDETFGLVQGAVVEPLRQGTALLAAVRAAFAVVRAWQRHSAVPREDEDPLFVG